MKRQKKLLYSKNKNGMIPLHIAVQRGKRKIVEILQGEMENHCVVDNNGCTPMDYAQKSWNPDIKECFSH